MKRGGLLLILFLLLNATITFAQSSGEVVFSVLRDSESLTIIFTGAGEVSFDEIRIDTFYPNGNVEDFYLGDYSTFSVLARRSLEIPACLRFQLQGSQAALPSTCLALSDNQLYIQSLSSADLFWVNRVTNGYYLLEFYQGDRNIGGCRSDQVESRDCRVSFTPLNETVATPSVTSSFIFQRRVRYDGSGSEYNLYRADLTADNVWAVSPLFAEEFNYIYPSVSPDGSKIAFISKRDGAWDVFVINSDGSGQPVQMTDVGTASSANESNRMSWSPDGRRLAFTRHVYDATGGWDYQLHILSIADQTMGSPLTDHEFGVSDLAWSPNGRYILYSKKVEERVEGVEGSRNLFNIWVYDLERGTNYELIGGTLSPREAAWSPDGRYVAFVRDVNGAACEIYRVAVSLNSEGLLVPSDEYQLTNNTSCDWMPNYSADGTQIAYYSSQIDSIRIMNAQLGDRLPTMDLADFTNNEIFRDYWPNWLP